MIVRIETDQYVCDVCENAWIPREMRLPRHCPACGSRRWNECGDKPDFERVMALSNDVSAYTEHQAMEDSNDHVECRVGDHGLCKKGVE